MCEILSNAISGREKLRLPFPSELCLAGSQVPSFVCTFKDEDDILKLARPNAAAPSEEDNIQWQYWPDNCMKLILISNFPLKSNKHFIALFLVILQLPTTRLSYQVGGSLVVLLKGG